MSISPGVELEDSKEFNQERGDFFLNLKRRQVVLKQSWFQQDKAASHATDLVIHMGGGGGVIDKCAREIQN